MPRPHVPTVAARPAALLAAALIVGGCAGPPPGRDRAPEAGRRVDAAALADTDPRLCDPRPGRPVPGGQLTIALPDSIDPARAPEPANESERTVFRNFYETLVTIACNGEARPGLAESWNAADGGRRWTFALRAGACFWDGRPVTAQDVQDAWTATQRRAQAAGCLLPWAWLDVEAASVRALDARRLCILVPEPQADFPLLLAHPAYAVALPDPGRRWPLGTGPCRPLDGDGPLTCVPNPHHPEGHPAWERIVFAAPAAAWPAQGIDVALNADDAGVAGAEGGSLAPLPWNRIVLFLCPTGGAEAARWTADPRLGEALPDARPATALVFPGSWGATCPQLSGPAGGQGATARGDGASAPPAGHLLYPRTDPLARAMARRLATAGGGEAVGIDAADWPVALRDGRATGYVLSVSRCFATPCLQLAALLGSASWLQNAALADGGAPPEGTAQRLIATGVATPLVATRSRLAIRANVVGLRATPDGALLLAGAGRSGPP